MAEDFDLISFDDVISVSSIISPNETHSQTPNLSTTASRSPSVEQVFITQTTRTTTTRGSISTYNSRNEDDSFSITSQSSGTKTPSTFKSDTVRDLEQVLSSVSITERTTRSVAVSKAKSPKSMYYAQRKPAVIIAPKKAPAIREGKEKVRLLTNFYTLQVRNKIVYRYDINVTLMRPAGQNNLNLAKGGRDDSAKTESHQVCLEALRKALETFRMMREGQAFVYDGASIMFSSDNLDIALKPYGNSLTISVDKLPAPIRKKLERFPDVTAICIEFQACNDYASQFNIADFQKAHSERDMAHLDRTWKQFFEMLTNQNAISSGQYFCFGAGKLFPTNGRREDSRGGQERVLGANKGIKFIQSAPESSNIIPALVLDAKVGQFFKAQSLTSTLTEFMNWSDDRNMRFPFHNDPKFPSRMNKDWKSVNDYIKGIRLIYNGSSGEYSFIATGISQCPLEDCEDKDFRGQNIRTIDRFPQLNPRIHRFNWPAILVRVRENGRFIDKKFPIDLLQVAPYQRVPKNKQLEDPPRAGPPQKRFGDIKSLMCELDLDCGGARNYFLNAFGVTLSDRPIEVEAIRRERPKIIYESGQGSRTITTQSESATWHMDRGDKYVGPGEVGLLFVAHTCPKQIAEQMAGKIMECAGKRGMNLSRSFYHQYNDQSDPLENMDHLFKNLQVEQQKGSFPEKILVLYVDRKANKSHGLLKLFERQYLILTQHITTEVAKKLINQPATCSNIVNKLNCKVYGLNHSIKPDQFTQNAWITNGKSLVIGYDVAHPPPQLRSEILDKKPPMSPSVVGLAFNGGKHVESFVGDFHFQTPRKEEVNDQLLISRMKWMLTLFEKNRHCLPENIFIYRDGVSEGQYAMVMQNEIEALKQGVDEFRNLRNLLDYNPNYVVLVVTKRHNTRFVRETHRGIDNTLPGTVVDTGIVRADATEFHLQGHRVLQGTGKTPSYVVLVDDLNLTMDELQSFTLALCFSHQIFEGGISLPEPVYQADEWAKRGNDIWKAFEERYNVVLCKHSGDYCTPPIDFEEMTRKLAYWNTRLEGSRINA